MSDEEFFASRAPDISAKSGESRKRAIVALKETNPRLFNDFQVATRKLEAASEFIKSCERFELTAVGKLNTYPLFAETIGAVVNSTGRAGFIVPTGIATDDSTKDFFAHITQKGKLVSLYDFENREAVFPAVHRSYKFCLLTLGFAAHAEFVCFATQSYQLGDSRRRFRLTPDEFRLISPNTLTCPIFRSERDAEITKKLYRAAPILMNDGDGDGNPWEVSFSQGLFNMTSDSGLFSSAPSETSVPLYEAKLIHHFDHRWATYTEGGVSRDLTQDEKRDTSFRVKPRYWVQRSEVEKRLEQKGWDRGWLMGWRDICRATDERTVIASIFPRVGAGDPLLLMFPNPRYGLRLACLLADQCCLVHDFVARQKVGGTHLKFHVKKQLPILPPARYAERDISFIVSRVLELTFTAEDVRSWAEDLNYSGSPFSFDPDRRAILRAELDAYYAYLYGLTRDELRYILDPTDIMGEDYPSETFRVLKNKEVSSFGEYRTRRLVIEAWDRLEQGDLR